jgi:hypothetical protein
MIRLILQIVFCLKHGFQTKTGAEAWFKRQCLSENLSYQKDSQRRQDG